MSRHEVECSCGHTCIVDVAWKELENTSKYYKEHKLCPDCYRAQKEKELLNDFELVEMKYSSFKNECPEWKTKANSYNAKEKTILVYAPKSSYINGLIERYDIQLGKPGEPAMMIHGMKHFKEDGKPLGTIKLYKKQILAELNRRT